MSEKPMTSHDRAKGIVAQFAPWIPLPIMRKLAGTIAAAIQAATKDLETLFAQQAQRADEAEAREVSAQVRIVEMRRELDAARGELSMLRRRLEAK